MPDNDKRGRVALFLKNNSQPRICPKTGRTIKYNKHRLYRLLFPFIGIVALIWFLIRVIPKPSRATYPCQRVAFPLASGCIVWLLGLIGSTLAYRKAKRMYQKCRYVAAAIAVVAAVAAIFWSMSLTTKNFAYSAPFVPVDPPNSPIGTAKGINPGRVVWIRDTNVTNWNGHDNYWWQDTHTDPNVADTMMSNAIHNLTGYADQAKAWDAIFRYFNLTHSDQDVGYQQGEKIAIKINNIFSRSYTWNNQKNKPSPQMIHAILRQLIEVAGVSDSDITIYDCIFYQGDPVYNYCHADFPGVRFAEGDATDRSGYEGGPGPNPGERIKVVPDPNARIYYGDPNIVPDSGSVCLPTVVSEAKYLIDIALPRAHELAGVTICAKNFFGSVWHPNDYQYYYGWNPAIMHESVAAYDYDDLTARPMGSYNALVDLLGHKELGGKVLLFFVECLYEYDNWSAPPFDNDWVSSLFVSQDGVAIDSVLLDFLRAQGLLSAGAIDNYLHEAALADNPPSGTFYDPENDGTALESLGVHEHWNNATDKQYSRNLDPNNGTGIELVTKATLSGDFDGLASVNLADFAVLAAAWHSQPTDTNWNPSCDISIIRDNIIDTQDLIVFCNNWLK